MKKKKISELPLSSSLQGLHTIGVDSNNQSVKVSLEFVKDAADSANEAATNANEAAEAATEAAEGIEQRVEDITHGYFETMGVGIATNLKGQNTVDAEFAYRKSGGNVEVADGNAMIEAIKGNTIAWNQLIQPNTFSTYQKNTTFSNGMFTVDVTGQDTYIIFNAVEPIINHKYYLSIFCSVPSGVTTRYGFPNASSNIITLVNGRNHWLITYKSGTLVLDDSDNSAYAKTTFKDFVFIDLTLIYGEGKEPATPEQFEQDYFNWFGKPLTYEPYDAGSLRNTKVSALKTVGFNLWNEEWRNGYYNESLDGSFVASASYVATNDFIQIESNKAYYGKFQSVVFVLFYRADKTYISFVRMNTEGIFTTPSDCAFITFYCAASYGTTYNHDICINLSDPNRNGEYEPYKESTLPLDITTLTGKLNGEGSSVVVFADGMGENDEIRIEGDVVKAYKRGTIVDMGDDLLFEYRDNIFETTIASRIFKNNGNVISTKFIQKEAYANNLVNNEMTTKPTFNNNDLCFKDTAYTGADLVSGKATWLSGTKLYLELAEPEVYVLDDFNLPKLYPVANGGTEEQLSNSPNSLPATLSIRYGLNAAAFIQNAPKNYISKESMTNFLSNLGSAMGGTWSMIWNSSTNKYDFSFTQNRSADVEQPIEDK